MDAAYKRLEVTAGVDMDSWSKVIDNWVDRGLELAAVGVMKVHDELWRRDSPSMPVSPLGISFEGNYEV